MSHLAEVENRVGEVVGPPVVALGACVASLPVPMHDGLKDGGERCHADARADEDGVLRAEDLRGRRPERTVDVHLAKAQHFKWKRFPIKSL